MSAVREINLYPHQVAAEHALRDRRRNGANNVLLVAPTAFGKTETVIDVVQSAIRKGKRVWFVVDRVALVDQTVERLGQYGIEAGVIQGDHVLTDADKLVQVVSAQTLGRRKLDLPDLIIWDECHTRYKVMRDLVKRAREAGVMVIGLTATPFTSGMAEDWDAFVNGATVNELLAKGYLTPLKIKACVTADMTGVKKRPNGEYEDEEAGQRGIQIIGDVIPTWVEQTKIHFGGPVKTIVFVASVAQGEELCRQFADAGYNFQQISYLDRSDKDRAAKIAEFRKPDSAIHGLVSCAVLTKGFDVPDVMCGISCRPYVRSFSSHIQELGRIVRVAPGKQFALLLDHSGNVVSFAEETAWLYEHGVDSLSDAQKKDSVEREPSERVKQKHFCGGCGMQMEPMAEACPYCGWERPKRGEIQSVEGTLIDFDISTKAVFQPRAGLRAECLKHPHAVWNAALCYCLANTRKGPEAGRKWAYGIWAGIYPTSKLPHGLYDAPSRPGTVNPDAWGLVEREVARFRKGTKRRAAA